MVITVISFSKSQSSIFSSRLCINILFGPRNTCTDMNIFNFMDTCQCVRRHVYYKIITYLLPFIWLLSCRRQTAKLMGANMFWVYIVLVEHGRLVKINGCKFAMKDQRTFFRISDIIYILK